MTLTVAVVPLKASSWSPLTLPRMIAGILYSACGTGQLDRDACHVHPGNFCTTTMQVRPFYLTPLLIAVAYFLAKPLPTKSS